MHPLKTHTHTQRVKKTNNQTVHSEEKILREKCLLQDYFALDTTNRKREINPTIFAYNRRAHFSNRKQ